MKLTPNMSNTDHILRLVIVAIFAALYFTGTVAGTPGPTLLVLAVVFLFTSTTAFCPIYRIFNLSTRK